MPNSNNSASLKELLRKSPVRTLIVVMHFFLLMVVFSIYLNIQQRETSKKWTENSSNLLSKVIISRQKQNFIAAKILAISLSETKAIKEQDMNACREIFGRVLKETPLFANLGVADAKGNIWCSAVPLKEPVSIADRPYFKETIDHKKLALGQYTIGRVVNKPTVQVANPVFDGSKVKGVVVLSIDLAWLNKMVANINLPDGSHAGIFDNSGMLLAHYPEKSEWLGKKVVNALPNATEENLYPTEFNTFFSSGPDNIKRVYNTYRFPDDIGEGVYFFVGIPEASFASASNKTAADNLPVMGIFILIILTTLFIDWKLLKLSP